MEEFFREKLNVSSEYLQIRKSHQGSNILLFNVNVTSPAEYETSSNEIVG